jgi:hypothetical protein
LVSLIKEINLGTDIIQSESVLPNISQLQINRYDRQSVKTTDILINSVNIKAPLFTDIQIQDTQIFP